MEPTLVSTLVCPLTPQVRWLRMPTRGTKTHKNYTEVGSIDRMCMTQTACSISHHTYRQNHNRQPHKRGGWNLLKIHLHHDNQLSQVHLKANSLPQMTIHSTFATLYGGVRTAIRKNNKTPHAIGTETTRRHTKRDPLSTVQTLQVGCKQQSSPAQRACKRRRNTPVYCECSIQK